MTALSPLNGPTVANTQKMFLLDPLKRMIKKKKKESKESKHHLKNFVKKRTAMFYYPPLALYCR